MADRELIKSKNMKVSFKDFKTQLPEGLVVSNGRVNFDVGKADKDFKLSLYAEYNDIDKVPVRVGIKDIVTQGNTTNITDEVIDCIDLASMTLTFLIPETKTFHSYRLKVYPDVIQKELS